MLLCLAGGSRFMIPSRWASLLHGAFEPSATRHDVFALIVLGCLVSQILNSLRRVGRFNEAEALLRPIIGCQQTLQYRNKTEVHSSLCVPGRAGWQCFYIMPSAVCCTKPRPAAKLMPIAFHTVCDMQSMLLSYAWLMGLATICFMLTVIMVTTLTRSLTAAAVTCSSISGKHAELGTPTAPQRRMAAWRLACCRVGTGTKGAASYPWTSAGCRTTPPTQS